MEELSRNFVLTLAHNKGYFNYEGLDYGTDLQIRKAIRRRENGRARYLTSGRAIDVQLKAVSEEGVTYLEKSIKYTLEVKNYNDLVQRAKEQGGDLIPLILIVFVVPPDTDKWVECLNDGVIIRKEAYWYLLPSNSEYSENSSSVTIEIPKANKVTAELFPNLFSTLWS
jgi:hypothetical protein